MGQTSVQEVDVQAIDRAGKVYFFGTSDGKTIKIGYTDGSLTKRRKEILRGQMVSVELHLLAAIRATGTHEKAIQRHFVHLKDDLNSTETFHAVPELVEYVNLASSAMVDVFKGG